MKKLPLLAAVFMMTACTTHMADLTIVSDQNVNLNQINLDKMPQIRNVSGTDDAYTFIVIPLGTPTLKGAVNNALRKADGDLIVDASVDYHYFWFLLGWQQIEINGTVINTRGEK